MRTIALDASHWRTGEDFWRDLLAGLEAPEWHGHNFDALWDTIPEKAKYDIPDDELINGVQPPFEIAIVHLDALDPELRSLVDRLTALMTEARDELGAMVSVRML